MNPLPLHVRAVLEVLPPGPDLAPLVEYAWSVWGSARESDRPWMRAARAARWLRFWGWLVAAAPHFQEVLPALQSRARRALANGQPVPPWRPESFGAWLCVEAGISLPIESLPFWLAALVKASPDLLPLVIFDGSVEALLAAPWSPLPPPCAAARVHIQPEEAAAA